MYIEQTGVKGYNTPIFSIQELSLIHLQIIKEGIGRIRSEIVNAENIERYKFLAELDKLQNLFKEVKL